LSWKGNANATGIWVGNFKKQKRPASRAFLALLGPKPSGTKHTFPKRKRLILFYIEELLESSLGVRQPAQEQRGCPSWITYCRSEFGVAFDIKATGKFIVIAGPSGVGKTELIKEFIVRSDKTKRVISHTTRLPRHGEVDGESYRFISEGDFLQLVQAGEFADHRNIYGKMYGVSIKEIETIRSIGFDPIKDLDVDGAIAVAKRIPRTVTIFLEPPHLSILRDRLEKRGGLADCEMEYRLRSAKEELSKKDAFDYLITLESIEQGTDQLLKLLYGGCVAGH
jgi:guanylate kinase